MYKKWISGFGILSIFIPLTVWGATSIPASSIDWTASTLRILYTPELPESPTFSCFGQTINPVVQTLETLGFDEGSSISTVTDCFHQAGTYQVQLNVVDNAGNTKTENYNFIVKASDPEDSASFFLAASECDTTDIETATPANNADPCDLTLIQRDRFENPVTQISQIQLANSNTPLTDDGNLGTQFLDGLRWNGSLLPTDASPSTFSMVSGSGILPLTAIAPSILKVGDSLSRLISRTLNFTVGTHEIDEFGAEDLSAPKTLSPAVDVVFRNLLSLRPYVEPGTVFRLDSPDPQPLKIGVEIADTALFSNPVDGSLENKNSELEHSNVDLNPPYEFNVPNSILPIDILTAVRAKEGFVLSPDTGLSLGTMASYSIGGLPVSYPAGGTNLAGLNGGTDPLGDEIGYNLDGILLRIVGVDIEGGILGDISRMMLQDNGESQTQLIAEITATDIREQITENAFRLIRGASNVQSSGDFDPNWFDSNNVVVVDAAGTSINLFGVLPSGQNTIIIKNGNLVISDNISYADPNNDSFGVILLNDEHSAYPETGNIFIYPDVRSFVGTYFADGGLMSNNKTPPDINTIHDAINTDTVITSGSDKNINQLLLTGVLFSKNTIGGALIGSDPIDPTYATPWETDLSGIEGRQKALNYDLHFVRRYTPQLANSVDPSNPIENRQNCAPNGGTSPAFSDCDANTNAFVIRIDRKVSELPPPGFELGTVLTQ